MTGLIKRDFKYFKLQAKKFLLLSTIIYIFILAFLIFNFSEYKTVDFLFYILMKDGGYISNYSQFTMPVVWFILHIVPIVSISEVIYRDIEDNTSNILLRSSSKRRYFYSKFLVVFLINLIFMLVLVGLIIITAYIKDGINYFDIANIIRIFTSLALENVILSIGLILLSQLISFRFAIFAVVINLSLAMLTNIKYILGQYSLVYKQDFMGGDLNFKFNIKIMLLYALAILLISYFTLDKYNFYGDNQW